MEPDKPKTSAGSRVQWDDRPDRARFVSILLIFIIIGLACTLWVEVDRFIHRRRDLRLIAEGRASYILRHQSNIEKLIKDKKDIEAAVDPNRKTLGFAGGGSGPFLWDGRYMIWEDGRYNPYNPAQHLEREKAKLGLIARQIEWERVMVERARWASEHPAEPWPQKPPEPSLASANSPGGQ
jgi:hypothetical protein